MNIQLSSLKILLSIPLFVWTSLLFAHDDHLTFEVLNDTSLIYEEMDAREPGETLENTNLNDLQGPCVINIAGVYHIYFAKHKGKRIYLATTTDLENGPWIYEGVVLNAVPVPDENGLVDLDGVGAGVGPGLARFDHIAAPDVREAEDVPGRYILTFHGEHYMGTSKTDPTNHLKGKGEHLSYIAVSDDPKDFNQGVLVEERLGHIAPVCVAGAYARVFKMDDDFFVAAKGGEIYDVPENLETVYRTGSYDSLDRSVLELGVGKTNFELMTSPAMEPYILDVWGVESKELKGDDGVYNYSHFNHTHMHQIEDTSEAAMYFWLKKAEPGNDQLKDLFCQVLELTEDAEGNKEWIIDPTNQPTTSLTRDAVSDAIREQYLIDYGDQLDGDYDRENGVMVTQLGDPFYFKDDNNREYLLFGYSLFKAGNSTAEGNIGIARIHAANVFVDSDRDGMSNNDEAVAGTNPYNPDSYFQISDAMFSNGTVSVEWESVTNRIYEIYISSNLVHWSVYTNNIVADPPINWFQLPASWSNAFFRLGVE